MKKIACICFILFLPFIVSAQLKYLQNSQVSTSHPRILLTQGEEELIKKTITSNKTWQKVHQTIINESDRIVSLPLLQRIQIGRRFLDKSRECIHRIFFLSYSFRMTHDANILKKQRQSFWLFVPLATGILRIFWM